MSIRITVDREGRYWLRQPEPRVEPSLYIASTVTLQGSAA